MKLIASGVANWAAIVRSPSFSRSSSSQTTTIRARRGSPPAPLRWSRTACSSTTSFSTYLASTSTSRFTGRPGSAVPERRALQRLRDQRHRERRRRRPRTRSATRRRPRSSPSRRRSAAVRAERRTSRRARSRPRASSRTVRDAVDVALDEVPAEPVGRPQRQLQVHRARPRATSRRARSVAASRASRRRRTRRRRSSVAVRQTPLTATRVALVSSPARAWCARSAARRRRRRRRAATVPRSATSPVNTPTTPACAR